MTGIAEIVRALGWMALLLTTLAPPVLADTFTDDFEAGTNVGGWTHFVSTTPAIPEPTGGNPGGRLRVALCCDLLAPSLRSNGDSPFTGDFRTTRVSTLALDVFTSAVDLASPLAGHPLGVRLVTDAGTPADPSDDFGAFFAGGAQQAPPTSPAQGWRTIAFAIPSDAAVLPPGWTLVGASILEPSAPPGASWDVVIQRVTQVVFEYGPASPSFPGDTLAFFDFSADNVRLETTPAVPALSAPGVFVLFVGLAMAARFAARSEGSPRLLR